MRPKDIIIGLRYSNKNFSETVYLGCGRVGRKYRQSGKFLIIMSGGGYGMPTGARVAGPDEAGKRFWNAFEPLYSKDLTKNKTTI
jgi:hypothetical protein